MRTEKEHVVEPVAARLRPEQAAISLGCAAHDIPILIRAGLLKPLGRLSPNAVKHFSKRKVLELCQDDTWLARMTETISRHWQQKNQRRKSPEPSGAGAVQ